MVSVRVRRGLRKPLSLFSSSAFAFAFDVVIVVVVVLVVVIAVAFVVVTFSRPRITSNDGEDVLVVVTFVALRESLGLIKSFLSLLLANQC